MAKDDYFVIVYQILSYLYQRLKKGEAVNAAMLQHESPLFKINKQYWAYIIYHMVDMGFIEGVEFVDLDGCDVPFATNLNACRITPNGIAYLCDNSLMSKVKSVFKDIKELKDFIPIK